MIAVALETRHTECEDQRDRLYALLSLEVPEKELEAISPNYRIGIPDLFLTVYTKRILQRAGGRGQLIDDLIDLLDGLKLTPRRIGELRRSFRKSERVNFEIANFTCMFRRVFPMRYGANHRPTKEDGGGRSDS